MTTALVEVSQAGALPRGTSRFTTKSRDGGAGEYKEVYISGPAAFKQEVELQGSTSQPAARYPHYLPVWDNEDGK